MASCCLDAFVLFPIALQDPLLDEDLANLPSPMVIEFDFSSGDVDVDMDDLENCPIQKCILQIDQAIKATKLRPEFVKGLNVFLDAHPTLRVGSLYSGTDLFSHVLYFIRDRFALTFKKDLMVEHVFSAEQDKTKREFIKAFTYPDFLFETVEELNSESPLDVLSGKRVPRPAVDIVSIGFPCDQKSSNNNGRHLAENKSCIVSETGVTGLGWKDTAGSHSTEQTDMMERALQGRRADSRHSLSQSVPPHLHLWAFEDGRATRVG